MNCGVAIQIAPRANSTKAQEKDGVALCATKNAVHSPRSAVYQKKHKPVSVQIAQGAISTSAEEKDDVEQGATKSQSTVHGPQSTKKA